MAASPKYKVYRNGEYVASCKYPSDAAVLVSAFGEGAQIRVGHNQIVWNEGHEDQSASESYDYVADTIMGREYRE